MFERRLLRIGLAVVLSVAGLSTARAATPTLDELLTLRSASRPRISPDGRLVAYEVTETEWKDNAYVTHIWLADAQSGRSFQLTRGKKSSDGGQWSPDGRWLAFFTDRESGAIVPGSCRRGRRRERRRERRRPSPTSGRSGSSRPRAARRGC